MKAKRLKYLLVAIGLIVINKLIFSQYNNKFIITTICLEDDYSGDGCIFYGTTSDGQLMLIYENNDTTFLNRSGKGTGHQFITLNRSFKKAFLWGEVGRYNGGEKEVWAFAEFEYEPGMKQKTMESIQDISSINSVHIT